MKPIHIGNVHEIYDISSEHFVIVKTDRISACGSLLPIQIKNKGKILNTISNFWFNKTKNIVINHLVDDKIENMPDFFQNESFKDRSIIVEKLDILPFEFIVRGYMFGRMWKAYKKGDGLCGNILSGDYKLAQKLKVPIITPTTKCGGHDENVDIKFVESHIGIELTKQIIEVCLNLYEECSKYALSKGLIIADTKLEFGLNRQKQLVLADEIFTPDSSRFWDISDYEIGISPKSYDKQLIRDWLLNNKINDKFQFDKIPKNIVIQTEQIYNECLIKLVN
ncbi:phosphoribosylaminoimidazole-succinocarboxamide synthase [Bacillus sp. J14TS2]|uniref:phosphoribosylaminoimidazolesuccinocarboxamide synthase n=1 Tax=Bacillus sp. J14TS2 TaxID=2807188 RepID=UPI001B1EF8AB|nr:phosphoribosylaminoimidazolesuccinocarboxamide synthase [Bacillus sp. J14TS2]GIN74790.1 phosphoribosylaminoimidazole-succinocarboxamide synthase [Bacillus sp. J14TS2]